MQEQEALTMKMEGFNRNIVECKLKVRKPRFGKVERFNRNIVECKYVYAGK